MDPRTAQTNRLLAEPSHATPDGVIIVPPHLGCTRPLALHHTYGKVGYGDLEVQIPEEIWTSKSPYLIFVIGRLLVALLIRLQEGLLSRLLMAAFGALAR